MEMNDRYLEHAKEYHVCTDQASTQSEHYDIMVSTD